ncbi:MAG: fibronectin type III domain-containing protein [Acidobacteria bacterium]|nr:fibronectin type III domain-containing protein [Acidobacteriota bacterium]
MRKEAKSATVWICTCAALVLPWLAASAHGGSRPEAVQEPGLRIVVIEGEDSVNVIGQGTAEPTVVEVRDRSGFSVAGASVLFLLREGGTATLDAGLLQVTVTTNALGQAEVTVNPVASGTVELSVSATYQGLTASTTIVQTNAVPGTGPDIGAIAGIVGGAAAMGLGIRQVLAASPPSAPAPPTVTPGDRRLEVSWTAPSDNGAPIDDYDVQYRSSGGGWMELSDDGANTNTRATIGGLTNGTQYEVQVRAQNSEGESPWSAGAMGTPIGAPSQPAAPTVTPGDRRLEVSWTAPSDNGAPIGRLRLALSVVAGRRLDGAAGRRAVHEHARDDRRPDERDGVRRSGAGAELGGREPVVGTREGDADREAVEARGPDADAR